MTSHTEKDVAEIASRLSLAQGDTLINRVGDSRVFNALRRKGLMEGGLTLISCGSIKTYLDPPFMTPLGLAVRNHLISTPDMPKGGEQ